MPAIATDSFLGRHVIVNNLFFCFREFGVFKYRAIVDLEILAFSAISRIEYFFFILKNQTSARVSSDIFRTKTILAYRITRSTLYNDM